MKIFKKLKKRLDINQNNDDLIGVMRDDKKEAKTMKTMTMTELIEKAKNYDRTMNEGGEGFNPYKSEIGKRSAEQSENEPRTEYDVLQDLEAADCAIARESGTYSQNQIDALHKELAKIRAEEKANFMSVWTKEVTAARREEWNTWIRSFKGTISIRTISSQIQKQNWGTDALKRAIEIYK